MPVTVLIAVDESDTSVRAAEVARHLFGEDATYLAVNVAEGQPSWTRPYPWGMVQPIFGLPEPPIAAAPTPGPAENVVDTGAIAAENVAGEAGVAARGIGEVGDPVEGVLRAAATHRADVVVVGSSDKSWFQRLVRGSVSKEVAQQSALPVLMVK